MINNISEWSRRGFLRTGVGATALSAALPRARASQCALSSELTVGPYYLDRETMRKDITEGRPGVPLKLRLTVIDVSVCKPIDHAALDIWHCDASGIYSGFTAGGPGGPPGMAFRPPPPPGMRPFFGGSRKPDNTNFLRGVQLTDTAGIVEFSTLYPGWYPGRAIHIHLKVHIGGHVSHTGQLFFPEEITNKVAKIEPYSKHHAERMRPEDDDIFLSSHGDSMIKLAPLEKGLVSSGYLATAIITVDPRAAPPSEDFGPRERERR